MIHAALLLAVLPSAALADMQVQNTRYLCERDVELPVVFVTGADQSIAVLQVEGRQILLYAEPAASGVRYGWPSDGSHYVWWTKGAEATLIWHDGTAGTDTTILATCVQQ